MLKKIKIEGLFNKFNYEIELKEEGITILTGPNGYGKTTILKIIYAFAVKNLVFFLRLAFKEIILAQEDSEIRISKTKKGTLEIQSDDKKIIDYENKMISNHVRQLLEDSPYKQVDENRWLNTRTGSLHTMEEMAAQVAFDISQFDPDTQGRYYIKQMPDFIDVYLIKEQRLIRKVVSNRRNYYEEIKEHFNSTIEEHAKELSDNIKEILAKASKIAQELDTSFPRRLFDETGQISEKEFNDRYNIIRKKQKSLSMCGLSAIREDSRTSFKEENAKALLVYLNDTEKKLAVFNDILQKLEIFSTILNKRQFVFKQLEISPDFGFRFKTEDGKELFLTNLSSGEQQEVVLLYELLFRVAPNSLVLIDEPEISLHVAWQKEVLNDLLKIVRLQKIQVITATHSPQIIGGHWDWVVDLEEISR